MISVRYLFAIHLFLVGTSSALSIINSKLARSLWERIPAPIGPRWFAKKSTGVGVSDGLRFECTGCGKCCTMDGDVWLAPEESEAISAHLNMANVSAFEALYSRESVASKDGKWLCLVRGTETNVEPPSPIIPSSSTPQKGCVFLDPFGKCSIYDVRPVQCRTYPFWPSLLESPEIWRSEAVLPDGLPLPPREQQVSVLSSSENRTSAQGTRIEDGAIPQRYWSPEHGGCEGIILSAEDAEFRAIFPRDTAAVSSKNTDQEAAVSSKNTGFVPHAQISAQRSKARRQWKRFPDAEIKDTSWYM